MTGFILRALVISSLFSIPTVVLVGCEASHVETTKQNWFGGTTHEETTAIRNPDGTMTVNKEKQVTR